MNVMSKVAKQSSWLIVKLSGAGFAATLFITYLLLSSLDLFLFGNAIKDPMFWIDFFLLGIILAIIIDLIARKNEKAKTALYILVGCFATFLLLPENIYGPIAAIIGVIISLLFYIGAKLAGKISWFKWMFASMPFLLLLLLIPDYTLKQEWNTVVGNQSYTAYFAYFNGEDRVPIKVTKGEKVTVQLKSENENSKYDYQLVDENNRVVSYTDTSNGYFSFQAKKTGTYHLIVNGKKMQGGFEVTWKRE